MWYYIIPLLTAGLGYGIAWVLFSIRTAKVNYLSKQQDREIKRLYEDFQRKEKDLNLEIMARDKKINSAQKKYETLQAEIQNAQIGLDDTFQEKDKLYFSLREEYEATKRQILQQKVQYEQLLAEKDRQVAAIQAERDHAKLKWESSAQSRPKEQEKKLEE